MTRLTEEQFFEEMKEFDLPPDARPVKGRKRPEPAEAPPQWAENEILMPLNFAAFRPIPVDCFPRPVRDYVLNQSRTIDCDTAAVALPVLSALAASLGSSHQIRVKGKMEPAVLWTALISDGLTQKTPPLEAGLQPLRERELQAIRLHERKLQEYRKEQHSYRQSRYTYVKGDRQVKAPPEKPILDQGLTNDWRSNSLAALLTHQPRGVLVCAEELDGWLGRPNPYGARHAQDVDNWVNMHRGGVLIVKQRGDTVTVPHATVSFTGTLEAQTVSDKLLKSKNPCPIVSRLLMAQPAAMPQTWTDDEILPQISAGYDAVLQKLLSLPFDTVGSEKLAGDLEALRAENPQIETPTKVDWRTERLKWVKEGERWADPTEVLVRIMRSPRVAGPGVKCFGDLKRVEPVETKEAPVPNFEDMIWVVESLPEECRARLEGLAFGAGWGSKIVTDQLVDFFEFIDQYMKKYGGADPRVAESIKQKSESPALLVPAVVELSPEAKDLYGRFVNHVAIWQLNTDEVLKGWFGHLASHAARLALVLHLARWASGEDVDRRVCDATSMERGMILAQWFGREMERMVAVYSISHHHQEQHKLIDWVFHRGGDVTARDLCRSNGRKYPTCDAAHEALDQLAQTGVGVWKEINDGLSDTLSRTVFSMGLSKPKPVEPQELQTEQPAQRSSPRQEGRVTVDSPSGKPSVGQKPPVSDKVQKKPSPKG